jgi:hypothetical protein
MLETSTTLETLTSIANVNRRRRRSTSIAGRFNGPRKKVFWGKSSKIGCSKTALAAKCAFFN